MMTMKINLNSIFLIMVLSIVGYGTSYSQPFTLDEDFKATPLELTAFGNGKIVMVNFNLENKEEFFHVKGHSMFEMLDVWIFSNTGNPDFKAELVHHNWKDVAFSGASSTAEDGIIKFQLRAYDVFGLRVYPANEKANITIAVHASEPVKNYLESPFRKATDAELGIESGSPKTAASNTRNNNFLNGGLLYLLLGIAIAVIAFLIFKMKSKSLKLILVLLGHSIVFSQETFDGMNYYSPNSATGYELTETSYENFVKSQMENSGGWAGYGEGAKRVNKVLGDINGKMNQGLGIFKSTQAMFNAYEGLGSCLSAGSRPGAPSVPSFCETDDCSNCFGNARAELMDNTYTLEQLKTIYDCNKNYTDVAIAFGNSWSSLAGGHGMAWSFERIKIEKSIEKLKKSYDKKYRQLMARRQEILMDLNRCEEQHGIPDWYDRFGHIIYKFDAQYYKRSS